MKRSLPVVSAVAAMMILSGCGGSGETAEQFELARTCSVELARTGADANLLDEWAKCPDLNVRAQVARNPVTPNSALVVLAADSAESVQRIVAGRSTDAKVLLVLAQSEFVSVRRALVSTATPSQVLEVLAGDPDDVVSGNARYYLENPVGPELTAGATLNLSIDQIAELAEPLSFLESSSYCAWYGGTESERSRVGLVKSSPEILRVNILGDAGSVIGSAIAQPVPISPEAIAALGTDEALIQRALYTLTLASCSFTADFPDLPRDQNSYTVKVLADKISGSQTEASKTLTRAEAESAQWRLAVTIP